MDLQSPLGKKKKSPHNAKSHAQASTQTFISTCNTVQKWWVQQVQAAQPKQPSIKFCKILG